MTRGLENIGPTAEKERDAMEQALAAADALADAYARFWIKDAKYYAYEDARRRLSKTRRPKEATA